MEKKFWKKSCSFLSETARKMVFWESKNFWIGLAFFGFSTLCDDDDDDDDDVDVVDDKTFIEKLKKQIDDNCRARLTAKSVAEDCSSDAIELFYRGVYPVRSGLENGFNINLSILQPETRFSGS